MLRDYKQLAVVSEGDRREFRDYTSTHAGSEDEQMSSDITSIRKHTLAYVRDYTHAGSEEERTSSDIAEQAVQKTSAYVSMRQHTSEEERMRSDITEQTLQKRQADAEPEADKQVLTCADVC